MATKRTKKTVISGVSREQYEQAFAEFAMADAKAQSLTAKMDQEMTKIREKYADQLAELNETKDRTFEVMQTYATENKDTLFSKKKSLESAHGIIGFRTGNPKLKNRKGFTWAAVTNLCKSFFRSTSAPRRNWQKTSCLPTETYRKLQNSLPTSA